MTDDVETFAFHAEITQLMSKISKISKIQDSDKEVFLWELISNSSRALETIACERFESGNDSSFFIKDLFIKLIPDTDAKTLTIIDSGIGMTKADMINNLGTIAKSGTRHHIDLSAGDRVDWSFGFGFYSTFLVSCKICPTFIFSSHHYSGG